MFEGILREDGYTVTIVQNPTTSLVDDVNATKRIIALQKEPVVLVGHPYGGVVITEAGKDDRMIPPPAQRFMAQRAGSLVVEAPGSHAIYVSQPNVVAEVVEKAAGVVQSATGK